MIEEFVKVCNQLDRLGYTTLVYKHSLKGICLATDYYLESWLKDKGVDKDITDRFHSIVANTPFATSDSLAEFEKDTCYYYYNNTDAEAFREAHLIESIVVSLYTDEKWDTIQLELEKLCDNNEKPTPIVVRHASKLDHISLIQRIFEFNPKHGKCGKGEHPNQSKIYCCKEDEARKLLNTAIAHPNREKGFCNYDAKNKRFIVFYPHDSANNKYHGFHYENTPPRDPDRDLNNHNNGIPKATQDYLKLRAERE